MIFRVLIEPPVSIAITGVERDSYLVESWSLPSGPLQASLLAHVRLKPVGRQVLLSSSLFDKTLRSWFLRPFTADHMK